MGTSGACARIFFHLIDFLDLPTSIVTDPDSTERIGGRIYLSTTKDFWNWQMKNPVTCRF